MGYPKEQGELTESQSVKLKRFVDTITGEVIQLAMTDTGQLTPDGIKIYAMAVDTGGGSLANLKPDGMINEAIAVSGTPSALPVTTQALSAIIQGRPTNDGDIALYGGGSGTVRIGPGETMIIESVPDVSWIELLRVGGSNVYADITILTNSTIV